MKTEIAIQLFFLLNFEFVFCIPGVVVFFIFLFNFPDFIFFFYSIFSSFSLFLVHWSNFNGPSFYPFCHEADLNFSFFFNLSFFLVFQLMLAWGVGVWGCVGGRGLLGLKAGWCKYTVWREQRWWWWLWWRYVGEGGGGGGGWDYL